MFFEKEKLKKAKKSNLKFNKKYDEHVSFMIDDVASFLSDEWRKKRPEILKTAKSSTDIDKRIESILLIGSVAPRNDKEAVDILLEIIANEKEEVIVQVARDAYDVLIFRK